MMKSDDLPSPAMLMLPVIRVRNWDEYFETSESRKRKKAGHWYPASNKHDGRGYRRFISKPNGTFAKAGWNAILEIASKMPIRGLLADTDGPLTTRDFADKSGLEKQSFDLAVEYGLDPDIRWLEQLDWDANGDFDANCRRLLEPAGTCRNLPECQQSPADSGLHNRIRQDRTGRDNSLSGTADLIQRAEAKLLFGELSAAVFGETLREKQWPNDMERWLDQALPLRRDNWELIDWFYRQPADHEIFNVTRRRQSMRTLIEHLQSEPQKIRSARQAIGLNGLNPVERAEPGDGWTSARKEAFVEKFGDDRPFPKKFVDLGASVCRQLDAQSAAAKGDRDDLSTV